MVKKLTLRELRRTDALDAVEHVRAVGRGEPS